MQSSREKWTHIFRQYIYLRCEQRLWVEKPKGIQTLLL